MNQYTKTAGSALFWGNRTKTPLNMEGSSSYTPRAVAPPQLVQYVYKHKKVDISIQPRSTLKVDGGFVIFPSYTPIAYSSLEVGTGDEGSGDFGWCLIRIPTGMFQNFDKITVGRKTVTLKTDGSGSYGNIDQLNIPTSSINAQVAAIIAFFNQPSYGGTLLPDSQKFNVFDGGNYIYFQARYRNTVADSVGFGVTSANPAVVIAEGVVNAKRASRTIQDVIFEAFTAGAAGNLINITYTVGSATATPEISVNAGNSIDIKIQSGVTTAQQIVTAVTASSAVNALITASLSGVGSTLQTAPVSTVFLDGGTTHLPIPWTRGDKLKDCFMPSSKFMCGYSGTQAASNNFNEINIPINTVLHQSFHALQLISHPNYNYGAWFRKNVARNATVKLLGGAVAGTHNFIEAELLVSGIVGNTYTFEIRDNPKVGFAYPVAEGPKFLLENSGKHIVLQLGNNGAGPATNTTISGAEQLESAFYNSANPTAMKSLIKFNYSSNSTNITMAQASTQFSGATAVAGSDLIKDGAASISWGGCRASNFPGYYLTGEIGIDGKSRIADDIGGVLKSSGKFGGVFARVVTAGTPFKSRAYIGDLLLTAATGGVSSNSLSVIFTAGATAGAEVVTVSGNAISIQISDTISTAEQIRVALAASSAASALVSAKVIGTPSNVQSVVASPTAISFVGGAAALSTDAGYFITTRRMYQYPDTDLISNGSYMCSEIWFSKDLSNPNSFHHVGWFDSVNQSELSVTGERVVYELIDSKSGNTSTTSFGIYSNNQTWNTYSQQITRAEGKAFITDGVIRFSSVLEGVAGNESATIRVATGATLGAETAVLSSSVIIITIAAGQTTIANIKTAIASNSAVSALITATAESGYNDLSVVSITYIDKKLGGAFEFWPHDGLWGFGYANLNEKTFGVNGASSYNTTLRKSPRGFPNEFMVESFRLTKLT